MSATTTLTSTTRTRDRTSVESAVVRFAGDSGDGMQLTGGRFTQATALAGNDLATFPDFPAEIRAPAGTTYGVSSFQINFGARTIRTAGDAVDMLIAMNPAALMVELDKVKPGGFVVVDSGGFNERALRKAGYESDPMESGVLDPYRVIAVDISKRTLEAVADIDVSKKEGLRCKNMWALGFVSWMYGRDIAETEAWLRAKFSETPAVADANAAALKAGNVYAETAEMPEGVGGFVIEKAAIAPGLYRTVTGSQALAWGLAAAGQLAETPVFFGSYPITPASPLLHALAGLHDQDVTTFQAEDEIAAVCAAIGASYAGAIGVTSSSGPGIALKTEAIGLAVMTELPLVIVNSQRAGPSTGLPTKTEQSDLYQAVYGRNADTPLCVLASRSPGDCFDVAVEAVRIALNSMTPVMLLTDGYIANAAEPWAIPDVSALDPINAPKRTDPTGFAPYSRDPETLARPWAVPGTPGLIHRIGGIEKAQTTGHISYDPANHQAMTDARRAKIQAVADRIPPQRTEDGGESGDLAVIGWGSTYGPISRAVSNCRADGLSVSHIHLRHIWPLPKNLGALLSGFGRVLIPEMNMGQLRTLLRAEFLVDAEGLNKVEGQPFKIAEIETAVRERLS
jgi:2-oxoglutarate ferredoxin oxidoreductase subunit alpha